MRRKAEKSGEVMRNLAITQDGNIVDARNAARRFDRGLEENAAVAFSVFVG